MKILRYLTLVAASGMLFFACSAGVYKNGVYKATYDANDSKSWKPTLEITVAGGKISKVDFDYFSKDGKRKTEDTAYADLMKSLTKKDTTPKIASEGMAKQLVEKQASPVDGISGATTSAKWFNEMAAAILAKAKTGDKSATVLPMNEVYKVTGEADERGYIPSIAVTFANGKITQVKYDEVSKDKVSKWDDASYNTRMAAKTKITWIDAVKKLQEAFLSGQNAAKVDTVTGATSVSAKFKELAAKAVGLR
jgi:major membrane immunogen (membrane-anchored lipoprotein)